jgi:hypothetical protein
MSSSLWQVMLDRCTGTNVTDVLPAVTFVVTLPSTGIIQAEQAFGQWVPYANGASATLTITATVNAG